MIIADVPDIVVGYLDDSHGNGIKIVAHELVSSICDGAQVKQVDLSDMIKICRFLRVFKADLGSAGIAFQDRFQRNRPAEIEALQFGAADLLKEAYMFPGLNALADGLGPQRRCHAHQLGQNDLAALPLVKALEEAQVELDQLEADALQYIQRGVAASEVIHPDGEPQLLKACNLLFHKFKITADHGFRNFNGDQGSADTGGVHTAADLFHHVTGVKIRAGEIDGLRNKVQAAALLQFQFNQNPVQDMQIQLVAHSGVLQVRNELIRGEDALDRISPSGQGFLV